MRSTGVTTMHDGRRAAISAAFDLQIGWCEGMGSRFTASLLRALADDIASGGVGGELVRDWLGDPAADALPLRFAGAFHALALGGTAPALAAVYPPRPAPAPGEMRSALARALRDHGAFVEAFVRSPPQTNEVGRSAVLLGGFLAVAAATGLPLRTLEIGASAGLNTLWDRFGYRIGGRSWGDAASPVQLAPRWRGPLPRLDAAVTVAERSACDIAPIDPTDAAQRLRLRAYVWADQPERLERLDGAIALGRDGAPRVERADAAAWVRERLGQPAPGRATVLYHSIMWQYLPAGTQGDILAALRGAGERATAGAPLAWLRFESMPGDPRPTLRLTTWPGRVETRLAEAQAHGADVVWLKG